MTICRLVTIDLETSEINRVGAPSGRSKLAGIATNNRGVMYSYQNNGRNAIYRWNKNTGWARRVFFTDIGNNNIVVCLCDTDVAARYVT